MHAMLAADCFFADYTAPQLTPPSFPCSFSSSPIRSCRYWHTANLATQRDIGIFSKFRVNKNWEIINDLRRAAEGGHDAATYLYAILLYRDNGDATADDTAKAGRGRRQYNIEMAEQRGVSAFAREGHACDPLLKLLHLG
jgi:hypothetical protein